jgi:hypothetical protein
VKLTTYVGSARDVHAVDRWMKGSALNGKKEQRLSFAFELVLMRAEREDPPMIESRLTGLNSELGARLRLWFPRENDLETWAPEVIGAFLVCGQEQIE